MLMVLSDFNLIVTTSRGYENDGCSEVWFLLGEIGDEESIVETSGISGLVLAKTLMDPFDAIKGLREMLNEQPWEFRYSLRFIPVEAVVPTGLAEIKKASLRISSRILENETFRVTVEKRHTGLSRKKIIEAVAEDIDRKVDLHNPDKIVLIEILGGLTGVSVIKQGGILSVAKGKAGKPRAPQTDRQQTDPNSPKSQDRKAEETPKSPKKPEKTLSETILNDP